MGEVTTSYSGGTPNVGNHDYYGDEIPFIRSGEINNCHTDLFITEKGLVNSSAAMVKEGDILYALYGATSGEVSRSKLKGAINQAILAILPKAKYDSEYIAQWLKTKKRYIVDTYLQGGQGNLSGNIVKNFIVDFSSYNEQLSIGNFASSLDHLITLHQSKSFGHILEVIVSCTLSWEQRKLGEVADIIGGGTPSTLNLNYWDGNIDWYSPAEIINQIYVYKSQRKITELGLEKSSAKMLPAGTVLFTSRAGIGKTAILAKRGCTNQGFQSIVPYSNTLDSYFIFSRTEELKKYGELVGAGSTFVEVSGRQMENMQLMIPKTIGEQHIIGLLFSTLDHLITLHQSKLEKLQKIKKSMLESMFV